MVRLNVKCLILLVHFVNVIHGYLLLLKVDDKNDEGHKQMNHNKDERLVNKVRVQFAKRIVPRDYKSPNFEYDSNLHALFVPKFRVKKHKQINLEDNTAESLDEMLLQPFEISPLKENKHLLEENLETILNVLKKEIYKKGQKEKKILRADSREKDLNNNPFARDPVLTESQAQTPRPFHFPRYSIWNYWTYDKNLLHDECPGQQVKVGTLCIWHPSARKYLVIPPGLLDE